jgi:hypothetical protein
MKRLLVVMVLVVGAVAYAPIAQAATPRTADVFRAIPVHGTTSGGGSFTGTVNINRFVASRGKLSAVGTVTGTLTKPGGTTQQVSHALQLPLTANGTCKILHLELGPLDLNLLGLMVHLDKVVLDITAQSGPGNLLGNLLCSIAHLLDRNAPLAGVVNKLNRLLLTRTIR